ncbi:MAG: hypothetical protein P1Q69_16070 [Candidatus Thorarchaeota archaeon]|nr:hypothetical protein [Candidatus Thorarchaeota archaeon]
MLTGTTTLRFIDRELRRIELSVRGVTQYYPLNPIPDDLYEGMASNVDVEGTSFEKLQTIYRSTVQKPNFTTFNFENPFPVNCATKSIRLTLTDTEIDKTVDDLEGQLLALQGMPFEDTVEERIQMYRNTFIDDSKIDRLRLGALEIYGDNTYRNVQRDPRVSLGLYWRDQATGMTRSYQVNAIAEIIEPGTPFFKYMRVLRSLFSSRFVETRRGEYVAAYKLWLSEYHDKSLESQTGFVPGTSN